MAAVLDETITTSEAARVLGVSEGRVRQFADSGALPALRTPHGRLFAPRDVPVAARLAELEAG